MSYRENTIKKASKVTEASALPFMIDRYVNLYHRLFPGEMRLFELLGIHPLSNTLIPNPFSPKASPERFSNIGEHSIAVSVACRAIAKALLDKAELPRIEFRRVLLRGLIHDIYKAHEILYRNAGKSADLDQEQEEVRLTVLRLLGEQRVPSYLVQEILTAGAETGHGSIQSFIDILPDRTFELREGNIAGKIVFLADALTLTTLPGKDHRASTHFVSARTRVKAIAERYPFMANAGLVLNGDNVVEHFDDVGNVPSSWKVLGSYAELQEFLVSEISEEFASYLLPDQSCDARESEELMLQLIGIELMERHG